AAESGSMTVGTAVLLIPFYPPVALAEELATLDVITGGRLVLGAGTGYREAEFTAFGIPRRERVGRYVETVEILRRLWSGEEVDFQGRYFRLQGARLRLLPLQRPGIPIWVGATGDKGVARAARVGDEWIATPEMPLETVVRKQAVYREALAELGRPQDREYPILRETCVAETHEEALAAARGPLATKYGAYAAWGHAVGSLDDMLENAFIVGDPDRCGEQIQRYVDRLGTRHVIFRVQWPGLGQREALRTIRVLGERVLPRFRRA
ncbi:MAG: LLM class flavin-dependent oxidoreductase, partial [Clostridia bacterium]|nr:LLM class flavin-dependent oxidoreductase [Clostridia bacterium]